MDPIRPPPASARQLSLSNYQRLIRQHNGLTRFIGSFDPVGFERAMQINGQTLMHSRAPVIIDRTIEGFWTEVIRMDGTDDKIKIYDGYVKIGGQSNFKLQASSSVAVTATGFLWLNVTKELVPTITIGNGSSLPNATSPAYYYFDICSFDVTDSTATITGRNLGTKNADSVLG